MYSVHEEFIEKEKKEKTRRENKLGNSLFVPEIRTSGTDSASCTSQHIVCGLSFLTVMEKI